MSKVNSVVASLNTTLNERLGLAGSNNMGAMREAMPSEVFVEERTGTSNYDPDTWEPTHGTRVQHLATREEGVVTDLTLTQLCVDYPGFDGAAPRCEWDHREVFIPAGLCLYD